MYVTDGESNIEKVSKDINAENTDNVDGNFITKWKDLQTLTTLNTKAIPGGAGSDVNENEFYAEGKMIWQGNLGFFGGEDGGMISGFPNSTADEDWTIVFGFQNGDVTRTGVCFLGNDLADTYWALKIRDDSTYWLYKEGDFVHAFDAGDGITSQRQLRSVQMQCLILQYDSELRTLYLGKYSDEAEAYSIEEGYEVSEEDSAPVLFEKWGNVGMGDPDSETSPLSVGTVIVWNTRLTVDEMKSMKEHIATL